MFHVIKHGFPVNISPLATTRGLGACDTKKQGICRIDYIQKENFQSKKKKKNSKYQVEMSIIALKESKCSLGGIK